MSLNELERKCIVDENGESVPNLNELEIIENKIFANVWLSNKVAIIDWTEGKVIEWIDLSDLIGWVKLPSSKNDKMDAVLNGIAFDPSSKDILVTGKLWNRLFKIHLLFRLSFNKQSN